jgi:CO/xanthine dehydrogenase Mo-binding subunit
MGYGRGLPDAAIARLDLTPAGTFRIHSAVSDMGQGNASAFVQIAGQALCQPLDGIEIAQPDTASALPSGSSSAGRTTYTYGNALLRACAAMAEKLRHRAALLMLVDDPAELALLPGRVEHLPSGRVLPLARLAAMLPEADRTCIDQFVMPVSRDVPDTGTAFPIGFPHALFAYAAHLAAVEVDTLTGRVRVRHYLAVTDGGRVLNPQHYDQQVHGAVAQGIGYALTEDLDVREGRIRNPDLGRYLLPTSLDVPAIGSMAVATVEDTGPFGMKGIGEVGINGPLPAIAGAVNQAVGLRADRAPLTPQRILTALADPADEDAP